ncbi:MAG TPA: CoA transferase [Terriglobales bacterium]|nr:CoA transferase [Terriglobales bacterium]
MSLNERQFNIYKAILEGIRVEPGSEQAVEVTQTASSIPSPLELNDFATAVFAAMAVLVAQFARLRGLPQQRIAIDRRQAGMMFNSIAYFFRAGWQVDISAVHSPVNNFFRTRDGRWIFFQGAYPHLRDGLLRFLDCANDTAAIAKAAAKWDAQALEDEIGELRLCAAMLRTRDEWLAHPQGRTLTGTPPIHFEFNKTPARSDLPTRNVTRPLQGVKVVDCTHVVAGPTIGRLLAEHGAEVIHVQYPYRDSILGFDLETSFGKKCVYLDLNDDRDRHRVMELAGQADVFIDGFRFGALEKHGLTAEALWKVNPGLVAVEANCYGFTGPWARRRGWEQLAQSVTGLAHRHSLGKETPSLVPSYFSDYGTGCLGAIGALAALEKRFTEGWGCRVRVALARTAMLGLEFCENREPARPIGAEDLERYLVDQESPHGLLTRVAPVARLDRTPPYARTPASFPGTASMNVAWDSSAETAPQVTHAPTRIFREGLAHWRGHQEL